MNAQRVRAAYAARGQREVGGPLDLGPAQERRVQDLGLEAQHGLAALTHVAKLLDRVCNVLHTNRKTHVRAQPDGARNYGC